MRFIPLLFYSLFIIQYSLFNIHYSFAERVLFHLIHPNCGPPSPQGEGSVPYFPSASFANLSAISLYLTPECAGTFINSSSIFFIILSQYSLYCLVQV